MDRPVSSPLFAFPFRPPPSFLLLGDADRREFREARDTLAALGRVRRAGDIDEAAAALADEESAVDVIVVAERGRDSFPRPDRTAAAGGPAGTDRGPAGKLVRGRDAERAALAGGRADLLAPLARPRRRELCRLAAGRSSAWTLPVTASEEDSFLADADRPPPARGGLVAIAARRFVMADFLAAACRRYGYATAWLPPSRAVRLGGVAAVIFDGSDCRGAEQDELRRLAAAMAPAPLVALLDFPRIEDVDRCLAAGAAAVLSKPLILADLFWHLERLEGRS